MNCQMQLYVTVKTYCINTTKKQMKWEWNSPHPHHTRWTNHHGWNWYTGQGPGSQSHWTSHLWRREWTLLYPLLNLSLSLKKAIANSHQKFDIQKVFNHGCTWIFCDYRDQNQTFEVLTINASDCWEVVIVEGHFWNNWSNFTQVWPQIIWRRVTGDFFFII